MSNQITHGPGGVLLGGILELADTLGRQIAALGIADPADRKTFCVLLGEALTKEFLSAGLADQLLPYRERIGKVIGSAIDAFYTSDTLPLCADLGTRSDPVIKMPDAKTGTWALVKSFAMMRTLLDLSATDFLDPMVWVQTAVLVPERTLRSVRSRPRHGCARRKPRHDTVTRHDTVR